MFICSGDFVRADFWGVAMTQNEMIHEHMVSEGPITPAQALALYGVMRLGARIWELRRQGYRIYEERIKVKTRRGTAYVSQYRMEYTPC